MRDGLVLAAIGMILPTFGVIITSMFVSLREKVAYYWIVPLTALGSVSMALSGQGIGAALLAWPAAAATVAYLLTTDPS